MAKAELTLSDDGFDPVESDLIEPESSLFSGVDLTTISFHVQPDEWIAIGTLRSMYHESNSQVRDPHELAAIQRSLKKNGLAGALIVCNQFNRKILGGHGKVEAAWQGGYRGDLPVVWMNYPSETEHRMVMLQLNLATGHQDQALQKREIQELLELLPATEVLPDLALDEAELARILEMVEGDGREEETGDDLTEGESEARPSLADRFIIPPFSVLDARQGYWQDRKRAWIALGIQSELGRGAGDDLARGGRDRSRKVSPGGSTRDAATLDKNGKTIRGDGSGKPLKQGGATHLEH